MGSVGCGSWSGWRAAADATRSRWRFGFAANWMWGRWKLRLGMLLSGTRACARSSLSGLGLRGRRFWLGGRRAVGFRCVAGGGARLRVSGWWGSEGELAGALAAASQAGFDLSREVPLRAHLFALGGR